MSDEELGTQNISQVKLRQLLELTQVSKKMVTNTYKLFNAFTAKDHAKSNASAFFGMGK